MPPISKTQFTTCARPRCLLCDLEGKLLHEELVDALFGAPGIWRLRQCPQPNCGLVWPDPCLSEGDLAMAYKNYYTHDPAGKPGIMGHVRSVFYGGYKAIKYLPSKLAGLQKSQVELRHMFLHELPPGKILDVGCGNGIFLNRMQGLGWTVDGLDFDPKAIASAKNKFGLDLRLGDLRGAKFPDDSFDAVVLSHVIEHVMDPVGLMAEIKRILKPGGRLAVVTPNVRSRGHRQFQKFWRGLEPPRHLNVFSVSALAECARRAGLQVAQAASTAANADIIAGGSYSIQEYYQKQASDNQAVAQINFLRALKCLIFQYREHWALRQDADAGEEAVLICTKALA